MSTLDLFMPLAKVDLDQRIVEGVATAEAPDRVGEICDYASTKPYFEAWSAEALAASGGKSLGAVRAMHGRVAAGKLTDISFDDEGKRILVAAKIVDDEEWRKVKEGVYTGFSQGGRYVKRWPDPRERPDALHRRAERNLARRPALPARRDLRSDQGRHRREARLRGARGRTERTSERPARRGPTKPMARPPRPRPPAPRRRRRPRPPPPRTRSPRRPRRWRRPPISSNAPRRRTRALRKTVGALAPEVAALVARVGGARSPAAARKGGAARAAEKRRRFQSSPAVGVDEAIKRLAALPGAGRARAGADQAQPRAYNFCHPALAQSSR